MFLNRFFNLLGASHSSFCSPDKVLRIYLKSSSLFWQIKSTKFIPSRMTIKHVSMLANPSYNLIKKAIQDKKVHLEVCRYTSTSKQFVNMSKSHNFPYLNGSQFVCLSKSPSSRKVYIPQSQSISLKHTLANSPNFRNMAGIQKLACEPTREHIENIRQMLRTINAKDNNNQEISLIKDSSTNIALVRIKSAAKNGISAKMMCDFLDIIDELYLWDEGKGVIIYGHNNFFCSGGDLVSVRELANYEDGLRMATLMQYNLARLQTLPMITMALIQGKAIGGGAEIATTMDLRTMTKSAKIGYVHARIGIVAAWGGGSRLVQLVGPSRAIDMMSSGRLVDSKEALNIGLVNHILDDSDLTTEEVMDEAKKYLSSHLIGVKSTIVAIKGIINAARTLPLEQALMAEAQLLSSTWGKPAHIEALNSNVKHREDNCN